MFFYRELPPSNVPPSAADLKIWFDGKNIDGSNNSTLVDGQPTNLNTVANLGTAGGSWISSDGVGGSYRPLYRATKPSIQIGGSRNLGLLQFDQSSPLSVPLHQFNFPTTHCGFMVFSYHTDIVNNANLWMSIDYPNSWYWFWGRNTDNNTKFQIGIPSISQHSFDFTPSIGVRY